MKVCKTATRVVFWMVAHACAASLVPLAAAGATGACDGAGSGETTNWKLPLIGDVETQGCCAFPVVRITSRPTSLKVWKIFIPPSPITSDKPLHYGLLP